MTESQSPQSLRLEIPRDASAEELADVCLALLSEPGVADFVNLDAAIFESEHPDFANHSSQSLPSFDVDALAFSPACSVKTESVKTEPENPGFWGAASLLLSKALRLGGPAQAGLSLDEVAARREAAQAQIAQRQAAFEAELSDNFAAWDAAVKSAQSGYGASGQLTLENAFHLQEKVWRVVERDARAIIRDAYREMWMAGARPPATSNRSLVMRKSNSKRCIAPSRTTT